VRALVVLAVILFLSAIPLFWFSFVSPISSANRSASEVESLPLAAAASPSSNLSVTFQEQGLPQGLTWAVTLGNRTQLAYVPNVTSSVTFNGLAPGSYRWNVTPVVWAGQEERYVPLQVQGNVTASRASPTVIVKYVGEFSVKFTSSGGGSVSPSGTAWYEEGQAVTAAAKPSSGYVFYQWVSSTPFLAVLDPNSTQTTVVVSGTGTVTAVFRSSLPFPLQWLYAGVAALIAIGAYAGYRAATGRGKEEKKKGTVKAKKRPKPKRRSRALSAGVKVLIGAFGLRV